jgi:outer membrane receptor protein involved in Fe transport
MKFLRSATRLRLFFAAFVTSALPALAQTVPAPTATTSAETVILTPFTVSTDKDHGYAATETLAGTRLRTELRDVAASVSVLIPELLRDLGANSIDEAIAFMPSSDKVVVDGNATGSANMSGWNYRFSASQQFSIRGVPVQGFFSDFFDTLSTSDFYNTERVTVSRGPNSILFGVGGPSGSVITGTKRPQVGRAKTQVALQADRWGSLRSSFDHNQPIVKDKLALRFNALHEERLEFRHNEGQWQDRATISVTAKPFKNTTITAHHDSILSAARLHAHPSGAEFP